jgi:hypothetical protein
MFKTKNDLPEQTRAKVVELPNARLADCIDLQTIAAASGTAFAHSRSTRGAF